MGKFIDLTGKRFGKLEVLERDENHGKCVHWICRCECGNIKSIRSSHLRNGCIVSCGCHKNEASAKAKMKKNKIEIFRDFAVVHLSNSEKIALIDLEDVEKISKKCWALNFYGYATTHTKGNERTTMHRYVLQVDESHYVVDHINHNKLDNRKKNLRVFYGNAKNTHNLDPSKSKSNTGFHNIHKKRNGKYVVSYVRYGKKYNVGCFDDLEAAKHNLLNSILENGFVHGLVGE